MNCASEHVTRGNGWFSMDSLRWKQNVKMNAATSETLANLDKAIAETTDLKSLSTLMDMKIHSLKLKDIMNSSKINIDTKFLTEESDDLDSIYEIVEKAFHICGNYDKLFTMIVDLVSQKQAIIKYHYLIVKLLKLLYVMHTRNDKRGDFFEMLNSQFIYTFLIRVLSDPVMKPNAFETLTKYFKLFPEFDQIACLNKVFQFCQENKNLDIFCGLLNHTSKSLIYSDASCLTGGDFWIYIERCISGHHSYLQKQGEYILSKFIVDFPDNFHIDNISVETDFTNSWQAFFVLLDVGREKQLHLVTPSLNLFKYVERIPFLWKRCLNKVYLEHSQTSLVYHAANEILSQQYETNNLKEIMSLLLPAINKNEYSDLSNRMFEALHRFCKSLNKTDFVIVIQEILKLFWNPVSYWKIIQCVVTRQNNNKIDLNIYEAFLSQSSNLPNIFIRSQCIKHIFTVLINSYSECGDIASYLAKIRDEHIIVDILENSNVSSQVIDLIIHDLLTSYGKHNIQFGIILTQFSILESKTINFWDHFSNNLNKLDLSVELLLWIKVLSKSEFTFERDVVDRVAKCLLNYYNDNLHRDNYKYFMNLFILFISKYSLPSDVITEIIENPLIQSEEHNFYKISASLGMIQKVETNFNIDIILSRYDQVAVDIIRNNEVLNTIRFREPIFCQECIKFMFNTTELSHNATTQALQIFKVFIHTYGNEVVQCCYEYTIHLLRLSKSKDLVINFINSDLTENLVQLKKDQYYKYIVIHFINLIFSQEYIEVNRKLNEHIINILIEFSTTYSFLRFTCIKAFRKMFLANCCISSMSVKLVLNIYLQGALISKENRTEFNLFQDFISSGNKLEYSDHKLEHMNPNILDASSRLLALDTLVCMGIEKSDLIIETLNNHYMQYYKKRYFPDSKIHFDKLRILQAMVLLLSEASICDDLASKISSWAFNCLLEETNQNCVKQLLNCIIMFVVKEPLEVIQWIQSHNSAFPSVITNVGPALYYLASKGSEDIIIKTINLLLPWTMGAQFRLRVYAQDIIQRLLRHARLQNFSMFEKYQFLEDCIGSCISSTGEVFENSMKTDLPFINDFHHSKDTSWDSILNDIPRLNNVFHSEWRNIHLILENRILMKALGFETRPIHLEINTKFSKSVDIFLQSKESTNYIEPQPIELSHIQKKITPWKSALENTVSETKSEFILLASLIGKSQNLGGLSRTCEVFGIRDLVFRDAKIIHDNEFKSLSMSSEGWINALEVKVKDLRDYIVHLQKKGYCVIGAEQTAGSKKLNEFRFLKKTALLLGNEKTGIAPDLIPLLDMCVEIPQFGQTRSLNVHVAGATFIWEYAKQRILPETYVSISSENE